MAYENAKMFQPLASWYILFLGLARAPLPERRGGRMSVYDGMKKFIDVDGYRLCYIDEGEGFPLVFIHGIWGSMRNWLPNICFFKEKCRVIALDLPACGESDIFDSDYSDSFFAEVILKTLSRLGVESFVPIGHSLGGMITLFIVLEHPDLIDAIILVDAAGGKQMSSALNWGVHNLPPWLVKKIIFGMSTYLLRYPLTRKFAAGVHTENEYTQSLIEFQLSFAEKPDLDDYLDAYLKTAKTVLSVTYESRLADITSPTLIIWGEKDKTLVPRVGFDLCRSIKGSLLSLVPNAAHVPQLEQYEIFNRTVLWFLKGLGLVTGEA